MGDIVIIGAGFAGLEAARVFSRNKKNLGERRIIVIDAKRTFDFLPVLPDVIGGRISRSHATVDLEAYLEGMGVAYENGEVEFLDTAAKEVRLKAGHALGYEYVLVCPGSSTNFYGNKDFQKRALKLDTAQDALVLQNTVLTYPEKNFVVVGAGYTGIEVATNIARLLKKRGVKKYRIHIVERQEDILGPLTERIKDYCRINLCSLRIQVHTGVSIKEAGDERLKLSSGFEISDYLMIWAAGVETPEFVRQLPFGKDKQGRLQVEETLRFASGAFAAGDAACFTRGGKPLRMAVQFSLKQGHLAAHNIIRLCRKMTTLKKYRPVDLGFLVPMANRKACGKVLFVPVWGLAGWIFHYLMCIYRSLTFSNRLGILTDAFFK
ncbi:MAG: FAD-dependent oxidoreductase [Candidatus Omnitrophota bacterium]